MYIAKNIMLKNNSLKVYLKLVDARVQPIAEYGAELWGLDKAAVHTEKVHNYICYEHILRGLYAYVK